MRFLEYVLCKFTINVLDVFFCAIVLINAVLQKHRLTIQTKSSQKPEKGLKVRMNKNGDDKGTNSNGTIV